ncbi:MAG TPA: thiol peroxidase [Phycisphaerae bacterium]|nr:thiol peroxidase [Phycisphaerae bacterium]
MAKITFKGNPINTLGNPPAVGSVLPEFALTKSDLSELNAKELSGKWVIMNIFPSIDTSVCSRSVRQFNQDAAALSNTSVLCISQDLPFAMNRFCGAEGIKNVSTLSAFRHPEFGQTFGVKIIDGPLAGLLARTVIVADPTGKIRYVELVPEIAQEPNYAAALAAAK